MKYIYGTVTEVSEYLIKVEWFNSRHLLWVLTTNLEGIFWSFPNTELVDGIHRETMVINAEDQEKTTEEDEKLVCMKFNRWSKQVQFNRSLHNYLASDT